MTDLSRAIWRKAEASYANAGCVEVAANLGDVVAVRTAACWQVGRASRIPPGREPRGDSL